MKQIGREVRRELGRFGPAAGMAELVAVWTPAVGEAIARHAWPARLARDGTLHVSTDSSAWAFELSQLAPTVLERLRSSMGETAPRALRFAVGRLPEPAAEDLSVRLPPPPAPSAGELELAHSLTAAIDDADLRELVARAAAASLARAASGR
ncbi:MAG: DUF721 domain-containing protein [Gaiellaceae bacterium]